VVEGKTLLGVVRGQQTAVRPWLFGAYRDCQRMVRDDRYKLIQYNVRGVKNTQLFDLSRDADEVHNLADDPKLASQRARLEGLMTQARQHFGDPVDFQADTSHSTR
jgi:arylsulfatase A-like enzyme